MRLPRRSLVIVQGVARYEWKHAVFREDVAGRRIAITFRELPDNFGASNETERKLCEELKTRALTFKA